MQGLIRDSNAPLVLDLSTRQLYAFAAVASSLSYTRAAEQFHYTEPGLYLLIRRLEKALGCRLFERDGRGLRLSRQGQVLLPHCRSMLADLERLNQARSHLARVQHLSVVAGPVTGSYLLPNLIHAFTEAEPEIEVDLSIRPVKQIMDIVARGAADLAVAGGIGNSPLPEHFSLARWFDRTISLLTRGSQPLGFASPVTVYAFDQDSPITSALGRRLEEFGIEDYEIRPVPSADAAKGACLAGLGYALLPRQAAALELGAGVLRDLPGFSFLSQVWICLPPEDRQSPASRRFVNFLLESTPDLSAREQALTPRSSGPNAIESRRSYAGGRKRTLPERTRNLRTALAVVCREAPYLTRAEFVRECSAHTRPCGKRCRVEYVAQVWGNWNGDDELLQRCLPSRATVYNNWPSGTAARSH